MSRVRFEPPQRPEKKKKTLGESAGEARQARISFKNYLRELEEQDEDEEEMFEEDQILPDDDDGIEEIYQSFIDENDDLLEQARDIISNGDEEGDDPVLKAVDFLMDELEVWLQNRGYSLSDIESWKDGTGGDILFDKFYNGLT
jgi:hypothetical protein